MAAAPSFPTITPTTGVTAYSAVVSRTSILFQGQQIPICIKAFIDAKGAFYSPNKPSMVFEIERENEPGYDIGRFSIMRIWDKIDSKGILKDFPHHEGDPLEEGDRLRHRRLFVGGMVDLLDIDPATGISPITQVMIQLAAEILSRESERELEIETDSDRNFKPAVVFAGGFVEKKIEFLGMGIGSMGVLWKNSQGQLVTPQDKGPDAPTRVAFAANQTWEQVIQERPLLNYAPGPVLPVFQDFSAFEKGV